MTFEQRLFGVITAPGGQTFPLCPHVFAVMAPRNAPAKRLVYAIDSTEEDTTTCGPTGLVAVGVALDIYSKSFDDLRPIQDAMRTDIRAAFGHENVIVDSVSDAMDPEPGLYVRSVNVTIWFQE